MNGKSDVRRGIHGGSLVTVLALLAGAILGSGTILVLNFAGLDLAGRLGLRRTVAEPARRESAAAISAKELELRSMLAEAARARERIERERAEMAPDLLRLQQERAALEKIKGRMDEAEKRLSADLTARDEAERTNTKRLAKMWAQMEPGQVNDIATGLDEGFTARILYAMSERQAAPILAAIAASGPEGAKRAAAVTHKLRTLAKATPQTPETSREKP